MKRNALATLLLALSLAVFGLPPIATAFCGFYVGGADASLYNDATMVVMMRRGNTTVLSIQNDYSGPAEDFALVVPVPEVLEEENVRTLPQEVFSRIDSLAAPRLVEYWERDPCEPDMVPEMAMMARAGSGGPPPPMAAPDGNLGVTVEAQFAVAEYDIVILSAEDSGGLETWLHQENYNIPEGASETLRPYVQQGTKFFVAKVDPERANFENGRAVLSPLRVHYDTPSFSLPVRLGLLNSRGQQDLIVHILAENQRYEVANYDNVFIPTNLMVDQSVRDNFAGFYRSLFDRVAADHPGAVVTEYSWMATNCDPCPTQPLSPQELMTFGMDVVGQNDQPNAGRFFGGGSPWTLTRLHFRYDEQTLGEDLVFRPADSVVGGRGTPDREGKVQEQAAQPIQGANNFQGRYIMLNPWEGEITCENPERGRWGGPPGQPRFAPSPQPRSAPSPLRATGAPQPMNLAAAVVEEDHQYIGDLEVSEGSSSGGGAAVETNEGSGPQVQPSHQPRPVEPQSGGCASCSASNAGASWLGALLPLGMLALFFRRRRQ